MPSRRTPHHYWSTQSAADKTVRRLGLHQDKSQAYWLYFFIGHIYDQYLNPWHWTTVNFTGGGYWEKGVESIPPLRDAWSAIGRAILKNNAHSQSPSPSPSPSPSQSQSQSQSQSSVSRSRATMKRIPT